MAITVIDGGARVRFDSILELVLWVYVLPFVVGMCIGGLATLMYPAVGDLLIYAVVATVRLLKSLLLVPAALGVA